MSNNPFNPFGSPPPAPPGGLNSLSPVGSPVGNRAADLAAQGVGPFNSKPEVRKLWFNSQVVHLDGYRFINCRFDGCHLIVATTNIELVNCFVDESTVVKWGGEALKVIQLFNKDNEWMRNSMPNFVPRRNPDGTVTIGP